MMNEENERERQEATKKTKEEIHGCGERGYAENRERWMRTTHCGDAYKYSLVKVERGRRGFFFLYLFLN